MTSARGPLIVVLVAVVLGAGLAAAGSWQSVRVGGLALFALAVAAAFLVQWIAFVPSSLLRSERFYDLLGGLTYVSLTLALVLLRPEGSVAAWVVGACVVAWSSRLALFLFTRVRRSGGDGRFDEIKESPLRLLQTWTLQGLWVSATAAAAWAVITGPTRGVDAWLLVGVAIWAVGLGLEVVADAQKRAFAAGPGTGSFITSGLWSLSRHPNYLGEILLWAGLAVAAVPSLAGWRWVAMISPVFVTLLLTRVSGVPLLERRAEARWGERADYRAYVDSTPILVPWVGRRGPWERTPAVPPGGRTA